MRIRDVSTERLVAAASTAKSNAANRLSGTDCPGKVTDGGFFWFVGQLAWYPRCSKQWLE